MNTRVYLRELLESDVNKEYLSWFSSDEVLKYLEVKGKELSEQDVIDYINHGKEKAQYYMHAICLKENDKHIGNIKIGPIIEKHGIADLPCVIGDTSQWGKGLATDAIYLGSKLAFEKYGLRKLTGQIYANNIGSIKAYCRGGWVIEGVNEFRYVVDNEYQDQVIVSCFNPEFHNSSQTLNAISKAEKLIELRNSFVNKKI
jgi:ribosomal-protein-alanine N-acetyltransferase